MKEEIKILYDENKVILSEKIIAKIRYLISADIFSLTKESLLSTEMSIKDFYNVIENNIYKSAISIEILPKKDNEIGYDTEVIYTLYERYNKLFPEENRKYDWIYMDENSLQELIDIVYQLNLEIKKFYYMRDLINALEDCLENMKYFVDTTIISQFKFEYEQAIQNKNIKNMEDMLNLVQQAILKEWKKYISNIDSMTDENFAFIGHSTSSTKFVKDFYSKYVSCSLFNQDLTDTYRNAYGFIFAPKNIIGANSRDMYVNNYVQDENMLIDYSTIKRVDHPQRLIDECLKQKEINIQNGNDKIVYSEVIIDGFEPIGIFCFTDGSKNLNYNYQSAKKLQEYFPHLNIYSFDIMKRKKGTELNLIKLSLLNHLQEKFTNHNFKIDKDMLSRYDYFFEEYTKLKQESQYTEFDIETLFKHNDQLLSYFIDPEKLFSGSYLDKEIRYILGKNVRYNIDYILSGKSRAFALNNLKILFPYKDKLNVMYDGLGELVDLVSRFDITDEVMVEINNIESISFYTIIKTIASNIMNEMNNKEVQINKNLNSLQLQHNELLKEMQERIRVEEQYNYYLSIYNNRFYLKMIKDDYDNIINQINNNESKKHKLDSKLKQVIKQLAAINKKLESLEQSKYSDSSNYIDLNYQIEEAKLKLSMLNKHPLLNHKKIKEEQNRLKVIEIENTTLQIEFETNKSDIMERLNSKRYELESKKYDIEMHLKFIQSDRKNLLEQLANLTIKINEYFKVDSIDKIELAILEAEKFINQYDNMNKYYLTQLDIKIKEIVNMILKQESGKQAIISDSKFLTNII